MNRTTQNTLPHSVCAIQIVNTNMNWMCAVTCTHTLFIWYDGIFLRPLSTGVYHHALLSNNSNSESRVWNIFVFFSLCRCHYSFCHHLLVSKSKRRKERERHRTLFALVGYSCVHFALEHFKYSEQKYEIIKSAFCIGMPPWFEQRKAFAYFKTENNKNNF